MLEDTHKTRVKKLLAFQAEHNLKATDICKAADIDRGLFSRYINNGKLAEQQARKIEHAFYLPSGYLDGVAQSNEIAIPIYRWGDYKLKIQIGTIYEESSLPAFAIQASSRSAHGIIREKDILIFKKTNNAEFKEKCNASSIYLTYIESISEMTLCEWGESFKSIYTDYLYPMEKTLILGKLMKLRSSNV